MFSRLPRISPDCSQERLTSLSRGDSSAQDVGEGYVAPIKNSSLVPVLRNDRAVQVDSRKDATRSRIGQHLCPHLPVSVGSSITSDRSCGSRSIRTYLEVARYQMLHPIFIRHN